MSLKQERIINDQQLALQKAHRALAEQAEVAAQAMRDFGAAADKAIRQIETGYPHCAASRLRDYLNELNSETSNDSNH